MNKNKLLSIVTSAIGSAISLFSLGIFSLYVLWPTPKVIQTIHYFFHKLFSTLPAAIAPICAMVMLILGLSILLITLTFIPAAIAPICAIVMLIFGLYSILAGLDFFMHPLGYFDPLRWFLPLIFISGALYSFSCIFLFVLKYWLRNLVIICSIVLIFYFIPNTIYLLFDNSGWGKIIAFSFLPYIFFPLFFIIFFTRPQIKILLKK